MKKKNFFIALLILGSLLSLTFGLFTMNSMNGQGHAECPFEAAGIIDCAQAQNLVGSLSAHVSAFSQFSLATLVDASAFFLALFLFFVFTFLAIFTRNLSSALTPVLVWVPIRGSSYSQNTTQFMDWLSLHENSPAFIARRA